MPPRTCQRTPCQCPAAFPVSVIIPVIGDSGGPRNRGQPFCPHATGAANSAPGPDPAASAPCLAQKVGPLRPVSSSRPKRASPLPDGRVLGSGHDCLTYSVLGIVRRLRFVRLRAVGSGRSVVDAGRTAERAAGPGAGNSVCSCRQDQASYFPSQTHTSAAHSNLSCIPTTPYLSYVRTFMTPYHAAGPPPHRHAHLASAAASETCLPDPAVAPRIAFHPSPYPTHSGAALMCCVHSYVPVLCAGSDARQAPNPADVHA